MIDMPLNYLLHRHQISLMRAATGATPEARAAHRGLADGYARRVKEEQRRTGGKLVLQTVPEPLNSSEAYHGAE